MIYIDTSALMTLMTADESTSPAVHAYVRDSDQPLVSSALLAVETRRAILRNHPGEVAKGELVLARIELVDITPAVVELASRLPDPVLWTLDAIHLATALILRENIEAVLTYDERLARAAARHGLPVASPGITP